MSAMPTFDVGGEGGILLHYSGSLLDAAQSIPDSVLNPATSQYIHFTAGTTGMAAGAAITEATSNATATVSAVVVTSGTLAGNDGAGIAFLSSVVGTFQGGGKNLTIAGPSTVAVSRSLLLSCFSGTAKGLFISVETNDIRFCFNEFVPTRTGDTPASMGHPLVAGQEMELRGVDSIKNFKFINKTASSNAMVNITVKF